MTCLCFTMFGDSGRFEWLGLESSGIFFTYLSGAWAGMSRLNCDCGPECLHEASPSGLGFLTTWQPQSSRTSYTAAQGFKSECFINQSRCCMAFYIPALEVTWHHFEWTLWMEAITGLPRCKWRRHRTQLWVAGISKNLRSYFTISTDRLHSASDYH